MQRLKEGQNNFFLTAYECKKNSVLVHNFKLCFLFQDWDAALYKWQMQRAKALDIGDYPSQRNGWVLISNRP